jgi:hypothetical protein
MWPSGDREAGSGAVLVIGMVAVMVLLATAVSALVAAQRGRVVAQTAADLGALAAATAVAVPDGVTIAPSAGEVPDACVLAEQSVARNGAVMRGCRQLPGGVVEVSTSRRTGPGTAQATARAGPSPASRWTGVAVDGSVTAA